MATDVAEVIGGAIALRILFHLPLLLGGVITGVVSLLLLRIQDQRGQQLFERVITGLLLRHCDRLHGQFLRRDAAARCRDRRAGAAIPREGKRAAGRGHPGRDGHATCGVSAFRVGPRPARPSRARPAPASAAARHPVGRRAGDGGRRRGERRHAAGRCAEHAGRGGIGSIEAAYTAVHDTVSPMIAVFFAVGLLVSGLASASVGAYAGAMIMQGLLHRSIPMLVRRLVDAGARAADSGPGF